VGVRFFNTVFSDGSQTDAVDNKDDIHKKNTLYLKKE